MGIAGAVQYLNLTLEVFFIDLLLSGDNAVVIALACRSLPEREKRQAMLAGTGIAIFLRVLLTLVAGAVLRVPLLKLLGGVALTLIAIRLTLGDSDEDARSRHGGSGFPDLASVIATVVIADLVMSADNVLALAAVADGSLVVLALGLLLSVPLLMFGSWHIGALLQRHPIWIWIGGAMLGWFAGAIAVTDPLYADWVNQQSPALNLVVPLLVAAYVPLQCRIIERLRSSAAAMRPMPRPRPPEFSRSPAAHAPPDSVARPVGIPATVPIDEVHVARESALPDLDASIESERAQVTPNRPGPPPLGSATGRAPRKPWRGRSRWLAMGGGGLVAIGAVFGLLKFRGMPTPAELVHYECPDKDVSLYYRPGGQRMRMSSGKSTADGIVDKDNQIDWGDLHAASTTLGFVPPTRVLFANSQTVRIDGGMFEDVACDAH